MIGLKRGIVSVVEYDPGWAPLAIERCRAVRDACGDLLADVQHVGSTAVPGLPAKPILDIAAGSVGTGAMLGIIGRLTHLGYIYRGDQGDAGGHLFALESPPDLRTVHLHVVEHGSPQWRDYLRFRDLLRDSPALRKRYAELKQDLAKRHPNDREAYTDSKAGFIREVLQTE